MLIRWFLKMLPEALRLIRALEKYPDERAALIKSVHELKILARKYRDDELKYNEAFHSAVEGLHSDLQHYRDVARRERAARVGVEVFEMSDAFQALKRFLTPEELQEYREKLFAEFLAKETK